MRKFLVHLHLTYSRRVESGPETLLKETEAGNSCPNLVRLPDGSCPTVWRKTSEIHRFVNSGRNPSRWEQLADVDWSGEVNEDDALYLLRAITGYRVLLTRPTVSHNVNELTTAIGGAVVYRYPAVNSTPQCQFGAQLHLFVPPSQNGAGLPAPLFCAGRADGAQLSDMTANSSLVLRGTDGNIVGDCASYSTPGATAGHGSGASGVASLLRAFWLIGYESVDYSNISASSTELVRASELIDEEGNYENNSISEGQGPFIKESLVARANGPNTEHEYLPAGTLDNVQEITLQSVAERKMPCGFVAGVDLTFGIKLFSASDPTAEPGLFASVVTVMRHESSDPAAATTATATYFPPNTQQARPLLKVTNLSQAEGWEIADKDFAIEGAVHGGDSRIPRDVFRFNESSASGLTESSDKCFARIKCDVLTEDTVEVSSLVNGPVCSAKLLTTTTTTTTTPPAEMALADPRPETEHCLEEIYGLIGLELEEPWCYVLLAVVVLLLLCCLGAICWKLRPEEGDMLGPMEFPKRLEPPQLTRTFNDNLDPTMSMTNDDDDAIILYTVDGSRPRVAEGRPFIPFDEKLSSPGVIKYDDENRPALSLAGSTESKMVVTAIAHCARFAVQQSKVVTLSLEVTTVGRPTMYMRKAAAAAVLKKIGESIAVPSSQRAVGTHDQESGLQAASKMIFGGGAPADNVANDSLNTERVSATYDTLVKTIRRNSVGPGFSIVQGMTTDELQKELAVEEAVVKGSRMLQQAIKSQNGSASAWQAAKDKAKAAQQKITAIKAELDIRFKELQGYTIVELEQMIVAEKAIIEGANKMAMESSSVAEEARNHAAASKEKIELIVSELRYAAMSDEIEVDCSTEGASKFFTLGDEVPSVEARKTTSTHTFVPSSADTMGYTAKCRPCLPRAKVSVHDHRLCKIAVTAMAAKPGCRSSGIATFHASRERVATPAITRETLPSTKLRLSCSTEDAEIYYCVSVDPDAPRSGDARNQVQLNSTYGDVDSDDSIDLDAVTSDVGLYSKGAVTDDVGLYTDIAPNPDGTPTTGEENSDSEVDLDDLNGIDSDNSDFALDDLFTLKAQRSKSGHKNKPIADEPFASIDGVTMSKLKRYDPANLPQLDVSRNRKPLHICAVAVKAGLCTSEVLRVQMSADQMVEPSVRFDAESGVVTMACATPGAQIRFTRDGTEPTPSSELYDPVTLLRLSIENPFSITIKAVAIKPGFAESDIRTAVVEKSQVQQVRFSPSSSERITLDPFVHLKCSTPGATIQYALAPIHGSEAPKPNELTTTYTEGRPVRVEPPPGVELGLFAIATKPGLIASDIASCKYSVSQCSPPEISQLENGTFQMVSQTADVKIFYTVNGGKPNKSSLLYDPAKPPKVDTTTTETQTIRAVSCSTHEAGWLDSDVSTLVVSVDMVARPMIKQLDANPTHYAITCGTPGATIEYSIHLFRPGENPRHDASGGWSSYSGKSHVELDLSKAGTVVLMARGSKDLMVASKDAVREVTVNKLEKPQIERTIDAVKMSAFGTGDIEIYYSIGVGVDPRPESTGSKRYRADFPPMLDLLNPGQKTFNAVAIQACAESSSVATTVIAVQQAPPPIITPVDNKITLAVSDTGEDDTGYGSPPKIYYTTDGTMPAPSVDIGIAYDDNHQPSIPLSRLDLDRYTVRAITVWPGFVPSNDAKLVIGKADPPIVNARLGQLASKAVIFDDGSELAGRLQAAGSELSQIFWEAAGTAGVELFGGFKPELRAELEQILGQADVSDTPVTFATATPDGKLDAIEIRHRLDRNRLAAVMGEHGFLDMIDLNGDGLIAVDELLEAMDTNKDFMISVDEFELWFRKALNLKMIGIDTWIRKINVTRVTAVLKGINRLQSSMTGPDGVIDPIKMVEEMAKGREGMVSPSEFVDALLNPGRSRDCYARSGDVGLTLDISWDVEAIESNGGDSYVRYTLDGSNPTATSPVYSVGAVVTSAPIDSGMDDVEIRAAVFGSCLPSRVTIFNVTFPKIQMPDIAVQPVDSGNMKVRLRCATPGVDMFFTVNHTVPTEQATKYGGKAMVVPVYRKGPTSSHL